jgi:tight adherence protein B
MDTMFYAFAGLLFAAVILLIEGTYIWWSSTRGTEAKRLQKRLRQLSAGAHDESEGLSILKQRYLSKSPLMERLLLTVPRIHTIDRMLEQSRMGWSISKFFTYSGMAFLAGGFIGVLMHWPILICLVPALSFSAVPLILVLRARAKLFKQFEEQLPEAADMISRALRAGHAFPSALKMAGDELPEPSGSEFRIVFDEINFGVPMNDALMNFATRMPLTDLRYFVIAVLIQRESGGNLAEILGNISQIIRERLKLLGRIRVLSAEGKMSAWVLGLLPFCVGLMINIGNPDYMTPLWTDPMGLKMVGGAAVMMLLGVIWMRSIIRIRV